MSFIKQYSFIIIIIIIVFSLQTYLCQQQYRNLSNDEKPHHKNKNSSYNKLSPIGKLLNSTFSTLYTCLTKSSTRILKCFFFFWWNYFYDWLHTSSLNINISFLILSRWCSYWNINNKQSFNTKNNNWISITH